MLEINIEVNVKVHEIKWHLAARSTWKNMVTMVEVNHSLRIWTGRSWESDHSNQWLSRHITETFSSILREIFGNLVAVDGNNMVAEN